MAENALEIAAILLMVTWLLGLLSGYSWNGAIHVLPVMALALLGIRWIYARWRR